MLEASILSTSPWNADPFLWKDAESVLGFDQLLPEKFDCLTEDDPDSNDVSCPISCPSSSPLGYVGAVQGESDYADILLDFSTAGEDTSVSCFDSLSLEVAVDSDWSSGPPSCCDEDPWMGLPRHTRPTRLPDLLPGPRSKSWLQMTGEEQLRTVEALTEVISRRLDLREQVEVIRIIDPNAVLRPSDKEFVIDLKHLDDQKLRQIADCVQRHAADWERMDEGKSESAGKRSRSHGARSRNSGSTESSATSEISAPVTKREARQRRRQHAKTWRQRKARQQLQKERRSGLFVNEQVLSLTENMSSDFRDEDLDADEDEEVDILH